MKIERDGKVAVICRRIYGQGWSTSADDRDEAEEMIFDEEIITAILNLGSENVIDKLTREKYNLHGRGLEVFWVPKGTSFIVTETDGLETLFFWDPYIA